MDTLSAERARRVLEEAAELRRDLRVEAAVHHGDRVVALLLGADAHAAVARDAVLVVAQDERVVVVRAARAGPGALEPLCPGLVPVQQVGHLLGRVAVHRVHIRVPILRRDQFHEHPPVHLDAGGACPDFHARLRHRRAGRDGVP